MGEPASNHMTPSKDPKKYITPFAFSVSASLYGTALASPLKRLLAILIDVMIVVLLAELSSTVLALLIALMFWQISRQFALANERPWLKHSLRVIASVILCGLLAFYYAHLSDEGSASSIHWSLDDDSEIEDKLSAVDGAALALMAIEQHQLVRQQQERLRQVPCTPLADCWQDTFAALAQQLLDIDAPKLIAQELMAASFEEAGLNADDEQAVRNRLPVEFLCLLEPIQTCADSLPKTKPASAEAGPVGDVPKAERAVSARWPEPKKPSQQYSVLAYLNALLADLGLSLGWAAFYFTVLSAWFRGQTLGKYILGIKVLKLNGETMGLWESFGRYGGYGAGLATGLMGFVQIYWDPNRQAIQDKISETLVIDIRKAPYPWPQK